MARALRGSVTYRKLEVRDIGKIRTTKVQSLELQKAFLEKGYQFKVNHDKGLNDRCNDFFYWDGAYIWTDRADSLHNDGNLFPAKFWDGEAHFRKALKPEYSFEDVIANVPEII